MMSLALTYTEQPEEALQQTHAALRSLEAAVGELDGTLSGLPEEAEEEGQALQATIDDLRGVMQVGRGRVGCAWRGGCNGVR